MMMGLIGRPERSAIGQCRTLRRRGRTGRQRGLRRHSFGAAWRRTGRRALGHHDAIAVSVAVSLVLLLWQGRWPIGHNDVISVVIIVVV